MPARVREDHPAARAMKAWTFALITGLFYTSPVYSQTGNALTATPIKDKWAVVVGISEFKNPSLNLKFAAKDASDFKDFLVRKCHFAEDHVKLLVNKDATRNKILDVLGDAWLPRVALPDDLVVIFISSHGSPSEMDVAGVNYVVAHDTNPDKLFTTGLPVQQLANTIRERVHSNRVLVILDACHSGAASEGGKGIQRTANVDATQIAQGTGHMVICSSSKTEASWESKKYPNGIFTHQLISALQKNGEGTKLGEAFSALKDGVQAEVAAERGVIQTPVLVTNKWKGNDLMLAIKPANPRTPPAVLSTETDATSAAESEASGTPTAGSATGSATGSTSAPNSGSASAPNTGSTTNNGSSTAGVPQINGHFIGNNGMHYNYWQNGRACGWYMPEYFETGTCQISEDGKALASTWTGPIVGNGIFKLECDATGKVMAISSPDGFIARRVEGTKESSSTNIPNLAGKWYSSNGNTYELWQKGNQFGWKFPSDNEVGEGTINPSGTEGYCSWTGRLAGQCRVQLQRDASGRVVRMLGDTGMSISRVD